MKINGDLQDKKLFDRVLVKRIKAKEKPQAAEGIDPSVYRLFKPGPALSPREIALYVGAQQMLKEEMDK